MTIICDEDVTEWKMLADRLDISENLVFIGPLSWEELVPYYHKADAFVLFSDYETFLIVLLEAMATGTPIISTAVGIAQNLPSQCGLLVERNNIEDLKNKMLQIVNGNTSFDAVYSIKPASKYSEKNILNEWKKLVDKHIKSGS